MQFLQRIKHSIISFSSYNEIINNSWKQSFKYFLGLLSILYLFTMTPMIIEFMGDVKTLRQAVVQMPEFTLEQGTFKSEVNEPTFHNLEKGILVIDEQESINRATLTHYEAYVVITKDSMYVFSEGTERLLEFKDFAHISLTQESLANYAFMLYLIGLGILLLGLLVIILEKMFFSVILALMGRMINRFFRQQHSFLQLWNVAFYALTLPLIIDTAYRLWFPTFPYFHLIYWGSAIFYLYWALAELKKKTSVTS